MSDSGPQTIVEVNVNGQRVHIYRRGKGGPVAICVDGPQATTCRPWTYRRNGCSWPAPP
jgi:putative hemolysin